MRPKAGGAWVCGASRACLVSRESRGWEVQGCRSAIVKRQQHLVAAPIASMSVSAAGLRRLRRRAYGSTAAAWRMELDPQMQVVAR